MVSPPWIIGTKLGYVLNVGKDDFIKLGVVGEYVTWLTVGTAVIGALFAFLIANSP